MSNLALGAAAVTGVIVLLRTQSPRVYDIVINHMTALWYKTVLARIPSGSRVLDIGIGTATALLTNAELLVDRDIMVRGVDFTKAYAEAASKNAERVLGAGERVKVVYGSVYDTVLLKELAAEGKRRSTRTTPAKAKGGDQFDAVYFSGSLALMPDIPAALTCAGGVVREGGAIYVTQTWQHVAFPMLGTVKPMIKFATSIDFGQLTYEKDIRGVFKKWCEESGFTVELHEVIDGSVDNIMQSAYLTILRKAD